MYGLDWPPNSHSVAIPNCLVLLIGRPPPNTYLVGEVYSVPFWLILVNMWLQTHLSRSASTELGGWGGVGGLIRCTNCRVGQIWYSSMQNPCHVHHTVSWVTLKLENRMSELDNFILLDIIQCIHLSGSGKMHSVSVKTGQAKGRTDFRVKMWHMDPSQTNLIVGQIWYSSMQNPCHVHHTVSQVAMKLETGCLTWTISYSWTCGWGPLLRTAKQVPL